VINIGLKVGLRPLGAVINKIGTLSVSLVQPGKQYETVPVAKNAVSDHMSCTPLLCQVQEDVGQPSDIDGR